MRTLLLLSALAATLGCLVIIAITGMVAQSVAQSAPALTTPAAVTQEVTAVCVGLNIGSCNVKQAGAGAASPRDGNPWPVIFLFTMLIVPVVLAALAMLPGRSETTAVEVRR